MSARLDRRIERAARARFERSPFTLRLDVSWEHDLSELERETWRADVREAVTDAYKRRGRKRGQDQRD